MVEGKRVWREREGYGGTGNGNARKIAHKTQKNVALKDLSKNARRGAVTPPPEVYAIIANTLNFYGNFLSKSSLKLF